MTITGSDGRVITFTGVFSNVGLTGTYSIHGGCADGDQGASQRAQTVITGEWNGTFTSAAQSTSSVSVSFSPSNAASCEGLYDSMDLSIPIRRA